MFATTRDSLELCEDKDGLAFRCALPNGDIAAEIVDLLKARQLGEMSVGYRTTRKETKTLAGVECNLIYEADLHEISVVEKGAVPDTSCILVDLKNRKPLRVEAKDGNLTKRDYEISTDIAADRVLVALESFGETVSSRFA